MGRHQHIDTDSCKGNGPVVISLVGGMLKDGDSLVVQLTECSHTAVDPMGLRHVRR